MLVEALGVGILAHQGPPAFFAVDHHVHRACVLGGAFFCRAGLQGGGGRTCDRAASALRVRRVGRKTCQREDCVLQVHLHELPALLLNTNNNRMPE